MQSLDLLVVNSTSEPFGLVILEAMACGTPVLATAVDGIPEIVNHGVNGWLVPPCDRGTMAAAISHLSKVPEIRSQLAAQGKEHVTTNFSANRYMNEIENFYQTIGRTSHELDPKVRAVEITTRPADSAKFA
jgi:glycosyltransferase involved in cell wall biosynthesis